MAPRDSLLATGFAVRLPDRRAAAANRRIPGLYEEAYRWM